MKKTIPLIAVILMFAACKKSVIPANVTVKGSTQDIQTDFNDPGKYTSIKIGTQKWMTTNLTVTRYRNGDKIPQVKNPAKWAALTTGAWCWYNNDSATGAVYGKLYNWYAVNDPRGLAPTGWHIPSNAEVDLLLTFLGDNGGGKMKETGTTHWNDPNTGATNSTDFTALPGGHRNDGGTFGNIGFVGNWWTSTEDHINMAAWLFYMNYNGGNVGRYTSSDHYGLSVRCLRD